MDIIDDKLKEVDLWLLKLDSARSDKYIPRPIYEKIKDFISSSIRHDFNMLIEGYDFFDQCKPSLRYRIIEDVFEEFKDRFNYCFIDPDVGFKGSKEFISYFITNLYCRIFLPNQLIVRRLDKFPEMYLIETGNVVVSLKNKGQHEFMRMPTLTYLGDYQIILNLRAKECYSSGTKETRMMCLYKKNLQDLLDKFPAARAYYTERARFRRIEFRRVSYLLS